MRILTSLAVLLFVVGGLSFAQGGGSGGGGRPSREDLLKRFDRNGDGELDEQERRAARAAMGARRGGRGGEGRGRGRGRDRDRDRNGADRDDDERRRPGADRERGRRRRPDARGGRGRRGGEGRGRGRDRDRNGADRDDDERRRPGADRERGRRRPGARGGRGRRGGRSGGIRDRGRGGRPEIGPGGSRGGGERGGRGRSRGRRRGGADRKQAAMQLVVFLPQDEKRRPQDVEAAVRKIKAAVKAGKLTPAQGRAKVKALMEGAKGAGDKKRRAPLKRKGSPRDVEAALNKIREAVAAGKLTLEEGGAKAKALIEGAKGAGDKKRRAPRRGKGSPQDVKAALQKIKAAVAAGKLTPEQGEAKAKALMKGARGAGDKKKRAPRKGRGSRKDVDAALRKIRAAVESGKLTPEQGEAKARTLRQKARGAGDK